MNLPEDVDAERSLLGAMLLSRDAIARVIRDVSDADFSRPSHAQVFAAISALYGRGEPVDPLTVAAEIGGLDNTAKADLSALSADCPSTSAASHYGRLVVEVAAKRRCIRALAEATERALDPKTSAAEVVDAVSSDLAEVSVPLGGMAEGTWRMTDFLRRPSAERPPWVVPGLLREGWRAIIVAPEGVGKTVVMRQIAQCAGQGVHPFTWERVARSRTLLVDLENPEEHIDEVCMPVETELAKMVPDFDEDGTWLLHRPDGMDIRSRVGLRDLEGTIAAVRPGLVCAGPLYKLFTKGRDDHEDAAADVVRRLDDLRRRYSFALVLEHHAPKAQGGVRELNPFGSAIWQRWPEFGLKLVPNEVGVSVERFRRDRMVASWPSQLVREKRFPWRGIYQERGAA